ncbi:hypothetical protein LVD15_09555 [Fulvivirga maritima]|uniref:hypothetical protein n=1 Tax=Fulvivirga maritima TaxID=2904247 RepID=UPI001F3CE16B|nr:hypothetical protein [Fulvivirga maritima]UII28650.1 hypothetical protein LVD15_09555 [Fulvivirga maritima]
MKLNGIIIFLLFLTSTIQAQTDDEKMLKNIFDYALEHGQSYEMLDYLSNEIGGRLSGSPEAAAAVEWSRQTMTAYGFDTVYLQEVMVPHWVRGKQETVKIASSGKFGPELLDACALGNSVGTNEEGVLAEVVEVMDFDELKKLGKKKVEGKIVFF